jgi:hypothetical protein
MGLYINKKNSERIINNCNITYDLSDNFVPHYVWIGAQNLDLEETF